MPVCTVCMQVKVASQYDVTPTQARRKNRNNLYSCVRVKRFGRRPPTEVLFGLYCEAAFTHQILLCCSPITLLLAPEGFLLGIDMFEMDCCQAKTLEL